ncbi:Uncharacterised protein [Chlamydia abortus]|nr:Uncharacterised protein [Chlamydia abortus]
MIQEHGPVRSGADFAFSAMQPLYGRKQAHGPKDEQKCSRISSFFRNGAKDAQKCMSFWPNGGIFAKTVQKTCTIALESGIAQIFPRKTCTFAFLYEIEEQNLGDSFIKRFSSGVPETFRLWLQLLK